MRRTSARSDVFLVSRSLRRAEAAELGTLDDGGMNRALLASAVAVLASLALVSSLAKAEAQSSDERLIALARNLSAYTLDPSQPNIPLDQWVREQFGPLAKIRWSVGSCDLKGDYGAATPVCVQVYALQRRVKGMRLHVQVATAGGMLDAPVIHEQSFVWRWCSKCDLVRATSDCTDWGVRSLSQVTRTIDALLRDPRCE